MNCFDVGDNVKFKRYTNYPGLSFLDKYIIYGKIMYKVENSNKTITNKYVIKDEDGIDHIVDYYNISKDDRMKTKLKEKIQFLKGGNKNMNNNEEKELKKDIEILLNLYISRRKMNRKEIKRFSDRHFDIIEKQNAKNTLKKVK